jgi:hypothetical protein
MMREQYQLKIRGVGKKETPEEEIWRDGINMDELKEIAAMEFPSNLANQPSSITELT